MIDLEESERSSLRSSELIVAKAIFMCYILIGKFLRMISMQLYSCTSIMTPENRLE